MRKCTVKLDPGILICREMSYEHAVGHSLGCWVNHLPAHESRADLNKRAEVCVTEADLLHVHTEPWVFSPPTHDWAVTVQYTAPTEEVCHSLSYILQAISTERDAYGVCSSVAPDRKSIGVPEMQRQTFGAN